MRRHLCPDSGHACPQNLTRIVRLARLPRPSCATGNRGNCFEDSGGRSCLRTLWQKLSRRSLGSYRAWNILGRLASSMALICRRNSILLRAFLTTASLALPVVPGMRGVSVAGGSFFLLCNSTCETTAQTSTPAEACSRAHQPHDIDSTLARAHP